jgi:hypothetical protein
MREMEFGVGIDSWITVGLMHSRSRIGMRCPSVINYEGKAIMVLEGSISEVEIVQGALSPLSVIEAMFTFPKARSQATPSALWACPFSLIVY